MVSETQIEPQVIDYRNGLGAVKQLCQAVDRAFLSGEGARLKVVLSFQVKPVGFDEALVASDSLAAALELLRPCLRKNPAILLEVVKQ